MYCSATFTYAGRAGKDRLKALSGHVAALRDEHKFRTNAVAALDDQIDIVHQQIEDIKRRLANILKAIELARKKESSLLARLGSSHEAATSSP